jgi:hypothetical protein
VHVAAYIEQLQKERSAPTAKLRLAALRHLFDWMVIGQIMPVNPAAAVRGPRHIVRRGKTPVLDPTEARQLIDAINVATVIGLRDRALIGLMVYSFARIGAAIGMRVEDVYPQNRRLWVRLHEKGGKQHAMPCHHNLETYLHEYIDGVGLAAEPKAYLFQTYSRATGQLTGAPLPEWKLKIAQALGDAKAKRSIPRPPPYFFRIHSAEWGPCIEIRPRSGRWHPFCVMVPRKEKDRITSLFTGPSGYPVNYGTVIGGECSCGEYEGRSTTNLVDSLTSAYVSFSELPSCIVFGTDGALHSLDLTTTTG